MDNVVPSEVKEVKGFKELATNISADLKAKGITRDGNPVKEKVVTPEPKVESKDQEVVVDSKPKEEVDTKDAKKGSYNHRFAQMTARIHSAENRAKELEAKLKEVQEKTSISSELEKIKEKVYSKGKNESNVESDEYEDPFEDNPKKNSNAVTKDELARILEEERAKIRSELEADLKNKDSISRATSMDNSFADLIKKDYESEYNPEIDALNDMAQEQVNQLIALYRSNPEYWLEQFKEVGVKEYADRLFGVKKKEKSAIEVDKASKSLDMEGPSVMAESEQPSGKSFSQIAKMISDKLAKNGITRK